MPERYAPGTPSWVDLSTPDVEGARHFYCELFGWTAEDAGDDYTMLFDNGRRVAGMNPLRFENQPTFWSTYFATEDVDALTERVRAAGGTPHIEPTDVGDAGRMAFYVHPAGGAFGAWQAGTHTGAELVNEPVSLAWNTLVTRDIEGAARFFEAIFGLESVRQDFGGAPYTVLKVGDRGVAGMMGPPDGMPDEAPAFWGVSFAVADADATIARAEELGGEPAYPPMDMEGVGRTAGIKDPYGAPFSVAALES
jgi:predicted enzyme related to lactoylglutathione lyase